MLRSSLLLPLLLLLALPVRAAPDLGVWDTLLGAAVVKGHVDYSQWASSPAFDALIGEIAVTNTEQMDDREKLVFYINTYNILAARGILNGHSPDSLLGRYVYFKRDKYRVAGAEISLYELEHALIHPLKEPRAHFAIVCASQSCPILRSAAYTLPNLDEQLDQAARDFINDPLRNQFNPTARSAQLSIIFKWFDQDFIDASGSVQAYLAPFVNDREVAALLQNGELKVTYLGYDWSLNGTK
jgi:hypothetical protein